MLRTLTSLLAMSLTTVTLCSLPGSASADGFVVKNAYGYRLGTAVVTNRARSEGIARDRSGDVLSLLKRVTATRWHGAYVQDVEGAGPTVVRRFATGTRWRIRFRSYPQWWRLVPRGRRWVLKIPGSGQTWASVSRRCPAPLAAQATLCLNGP